VTGLLVGHETGQAVRREPLGKQLQVVLFRPHPGDDPADLGRDRLKAPMMLSDISCCSWEARLSTAANLPFGLHRNDGKGGETLPCRKLSDIEDSPDVGPVGGPSPHDESCPRGFCAATGDLVDERGREPDMGCEPKLPTRTVHEDTPRSNRFHRSSPWP